MFATLYALPFILYEHVKGFVHEPHLLVKHSVLRYAMSITATVPTMNILYVAYSQSLPLQLVNATILTAS